MANSCCGQLIVTGPDDQLAMFRKAAVGVWPWRSWGDPDDKQCDLMVTNFVQPPWEAINDYDGRGYQWCRTALGTKWGAYDVRLDLDPGQLTYLFDTAWCGLAAEVIKEMSVAYPSLVFEYSYDEPGNSFEGKVAATDGGIIEEWERADSEYEGILCGPPEEEEEEPV